MFPIDNFNGIYDNLHARVLYLEGSVSLAIISLELTSIREYEIIKLKQLVKSILNICEENIWICVTHTFSAPHTRSKKALEDTEIAHKNSLFCSAIENAVNKACKEVIENLCEVRIGIGAGKSFINVNRDVPTPEGYWIGSNEEAFVDRSVTVIKFEDNYGKLKALLYGYDVQSSVMDGVTMENGYKFVSSDLTGYASSYIENEFENSVIAIYCLGGAGDVSPLLKAKYSEVSFSGKIKSVNIGKAGFVLVKQLGRKLGNKVLNIVSGIKCSSTDDIINTYKKTINCPGQEIIKDMHKIHPIQEYKYINTEEREVPIEVICFDDIAIIGIKPEISSFTACEIRNQSPFRSTLVLTMVNGGAKYMMNKEAYANKTYESMNSFFARGSAEILRDSLLIMLNEIKERKEK